jgi:hypothetical protein
MGEDTHEPGYNSGCLGELARVRGFARCALNGQNHENQAR